MSIGLASFIGAITVITAFLTGIFGMAGGLLLMGVLVVILPVPDAMILHGITQTSSNGSRIVMMRQYVSWPIALRFGLGGAVSVAAMSMILFVPDKGVVLICIGLLPFLSLSVPAHIVPRVDRGTGAVWCGTSCMVLSLTAGVAGTLLDLFFVRSELDRRQVVATKAACNTILHLTKTAYFGAIVGIAGTSLPGWLLLMALGLPLIGNWLARPVLNRMNNDQFRLWTRVLVLLIGVVYLTQGAIHYLA